ncbi:hypothetical protein [Virgibacillus halodenitrificans]|uniref:Phage protein n=1 Tax=Virgibacillus halodenitrificans TaxID=1482 RepID=A0ABR7VSC9_VIRHA|nr:hypothetical protein [Virgibacillus halodenitrificans]MBD1224791.1 hypothetical protein [Virgibacillus halodenitrificans]
MLKKIEVNKKENMLFVKVEDTNFILKVAPNGLEKMVIKNNIPISKEQIITKDTELFEQVHESLYEVMLNEVYPEFGMEADKILDGLENQINKHISEVIEKSRKAPRLAY